MPPFLTALVGKFWSTCHVHPCTGLGVSPLRDALADDFLTAGHDKQVPDKHAWPPFLTAPAPVRQSQSTCQSHPHLYTGVGPLRDALAGNALPARSKKEPNVPANMPCCHSCQVKLGSLAQHARFTVVPVAAARCADRRLPHIGFA